MEDKIKAIMATIFEIDGKVINESTSANSVDNWDSLNHMNLILAIEEEFAVQFEEEEIIELMSYQAIKDKLEDKI